MPQLFEIDWQNVFVPGLGLAEIVLRGSLMYLSLFAFMRFALKRQSGAMSMTDVLLVVLIADAAQNGMAAEYKSITEGLALVGTIIFWSYALDWAGYRFPALQRFVHPPPLLLVKEGRLLRKNMQQELISEEELMTQLRRAGVEEVAQVKAAYMEGDGHISVISFESQPKKGNNNDDEIR